MKGDSRHGREVFARNCATCHRIGDVGVAVGPDISDSRERLPAQYLTDVLQPNRAVDANYFSYTALTTEGLSVTGILAGETSTSVTLKEANNKVTTLRRDEIEELHSNGVSLMPEGLEKEISTQAMADLIAFIKGWRYLPPGAPVAGQ
jgi:putative heme-binding domain-containing protein